MRCAILADIHANLAAFTAVLEDIERRGSADEVWCLGDIVGYGPDPRECLRLARQTAGLCVAGNHDLAAAGLTGIADFSPAAAAASLWTAARLGDEDRQYIRGLPLTVVRESFTLVHGSPREPAWEYLHSAETARQNLAHFATPWCLVGHTHQPVAFACVEDTCRARHLVPDTPVSIASERLIVNPGGVGQPRDGDPRASYAIYDSEVPEIRLSRVAYDIRATQRKMQAGGLPARLIERLSYGL